MEAAIGKAGHLLTDKNGKLYANPACLLRDRAWSRLRDAGTKLRLHLSSRMRSEDADAIAKQPGMEARRPEEMCEDCEDPAET